ncbi:MAG: DHH family phosphoesterase, partial [Candidatus Adiutrix sp.]|nr:DHH family phosphoesterase [Candidatus Adiutrix sp.]
MQWKFRDINPDLAGRLARELGQPQKLGEFLAARGFKTAAEVRAFVRADFKDLPPPSSLTDMDKAVDRLTQAWKNGELTAVCGDYDADGLTATALLAGGLKALKHQIVTRIPHRLTDGYGLKPPLVEKMAADGVKLAVTVDNGISAHEAVEAASALGLDIIITDHHRLPPELPPAVAIINPHRDESWRLWPPAGVG